MVKLTDLAHRSFERILLINFGGIGDEILFFPVIKALRQHYPETHLSILVEPRCRNIMEHHYYLDEVLTFDIKHRKHPSDLLELLSLLKSADPELIISSGSSPFVALLLFLSGTPYRVGYGSNKLQFLLTHTAPLDKEQYAAKMYYDLLTALGFPKADPVPEMVLPPPVYQKVDQWLADKDLTDTPYVLIHPGVSKISKDKQFIKSWDMPNWRDLILKLLDEGRHVVLAGGPDDADEMDYLLSEVPEHAHFHSIYGATKSMFELGGFIERSELMICLDSAPLHIGVALQANILAIFGPTDEQKLLPKRPNVQVVTFDIACRPCLWTTRQTTCAELSCLKEISVDRVHQAVLDHPGLKISKT